MSGDFVLILAFLKILRPGRGTLATTLVILPTANLNYNH